MRSVERLFMFKLTIALLIITFTIIIAGKAQAGDLIAVLQYTNSDNGLTQIVYQTKVQSKRLCNALNKNYWKGVKTSCPQCIKDHEGCLGKMPKGYEPMLYNKPILFPYISFGNYRIVFMGVPMNEAIRQCKYQEYIVRTKLHRTVISIIPKR